MRSIIEDKKTKKYLFLLRNPSLESRRFAFKYLKEQGVNVTEQLGNVALIGSATTEGIIEIRQTKLFLGIFSKPVKKLVRDLTKEQKRVITQWNFSFSSKYRKIKADYTHKGKKWNAKGFDAPQLASISDAELFLTEFSKWLSDDERKQIEEYKEIKEFSRLEGKEFIAYERMLAKKLKNETVAYYLARIYANFPPKLRLYLIDLTAGHMELVVEYFQRLLNPEEGCWKLQNEISVGVVFVESSQENGPEFTAADRLAIQQEIMDGLNWLANYEPDANISWIYDFQSVRIDVAEQIGSPAEDYWRDPAMGQVNYNGNTYTEDWDGVADYREDMRRRNFSAHAVVIFVTPYNNSWFAYANALHRRITLADRNNWGGWGLANLDSITAHEMSHIFGATDEYSGVAGTPCSSCGGKFGCFEIPNGNCGACASPHQDCLMDANTLRICAYTQGHIGWADLFVELTTADEADAGTNDAVELDIGDRVFALETPGHLDRQRNNIEGYALNYTGVTHDQVKRVGIRKAPDGIEGEWKLGKIRVWRREPMLIQGIMLCDVPVNKWLRDNNLWWFCGPCISDENIVNSLKIKIKTADAIFAGTDDDITIYLGGRSWELTNNKPNEFSRGKKDTFNLDPGTSLYKSSLTHVRIHKSPDGFAGGWKLESVEIIVNGTSIYYKGSINKWLQDDDRDWEDSI